MVQIGNDWDELLKGEFEKPYYLKLRSFLADEYKNHTVYPDMYDIFNAFKYTPYNKVKVVILGQDPYHNVNQAHGLAFSVKKGVPIPMSLQNIFKEMKSDLNLEPPDNGCLVKWTAQGVFLLNTALTVRKDLANSHSGYGWEIFTDRVISLLSERNAPMVFILWGANARSKAKLIDTSKHLIIQSPHPSPLSAYNGFFGSRPFSRANAFLENYGENIDWSLTDE